MPFDNFNKEPKETDRRWFVFFITLALLLPAYLLFDFLAPRLGFEERNPQLHHTIQLNENRLRRVRELCAGLPKPEKFDFIEDFDSDSFSGSTVVFHYISPRGTNEIMPAFLLWFNENGWRQIPNTSAFENGNQTVYISALPLAGKDFSYSIYCSEKD